MRLEAKGASDWRLQRGPVAFGQPQELTRSRPNIRDDPVGVMWAPLRGAWGQHMPEPDCSLMCRKSHTCQHPPPPPCQDHMSGHLRNLCFPESLSLEFRPLPRPSGLRRTCLQHLLLAPWQCLRDAIREGGCLRPTASLNHQVTPNSRLLQTHCPRPLSTPRAHKDV